MTQMMMLIFFLLQIVAYVSTSSLYDKGSSNGVWGVGATWEPNGKVVAGGNGEGSALNQVNSTYGIFVDSDNNVFVADYYNHRVVKWSSGASTGTLFAGGQCGRIDQGQLCQPSAIIFDKEGTMFVTVEDSKNGSVISWKKGATSGETIIIANTTFYGIALDVEENYLYVGHHREHSVVKYKKDGTPEGVVAGGNGPGPNLNQLDYPRGVAVDKDGSVYVSDSKNNRVMKWTVGATQGIIVAGSNTSGSQVDQLDLPTGLFVDDKETVYVVDENNHRIMSIPTGTRSGTIIAGGHGAGNATNQLNHPFYVKFNSQGDLYVSDFGNFQVLMFPLQKSPPSGGNSNYISNSFGKWTLIFCFLSLIFSVAI